MKFSHFALLAGITTGQAAYAQTAPPPPKGDSPIPKIAQPAEPTAEERFLMSLLTNWEKRMDQIGSFEANCIKTIKDKSGADVFEGKVQLMRPNFARLDLVHIKNKNQIEKIISNGEHIYEYRHLDKKILVHKMPEDKSKGGAVGGGGTIIDFLFGMKPEEMRKNYYISLGDITKADGKPAYALINILPKRPEDVKEFKKAQLALWISPDEKFKDFAYLPARLWFQGPADRGDETTWEFVITPKPNLKPTDFKPDPKPSPAWSLEWAVSPMKETDPKIKPVSGIEKK